MASMSESPLRRVLVQASHYSLGSLLTMVAGLISFPLLTRVFSVEDYGLISLVAAGLSISVALGKVGVQHSIVRYHSEIAAGKSAYSLEQLYSTTFLGMLGSALVVATGVVLSAELAPLAWLGDARVRGLLVIASVLVVVQVVESSLVNLLRAEQRSTTLLKYQVAKKYGTLAAITFGVFAVAKNLVSFYVATVLAESIALAVLVFGRGRPRSASFSRPLHRELLGFGIPMMIGYELSGIALSVGDRYVIEGLIGPGPLGLYGAAYNLCQYVQAVAIVSVGQAVMPIYMQMWDQSGPTETAVFVSRTLRKYVLVGAPVIAGLSAVGPELLPALASDKYSGASVVIPWVIAGMVVDGMTSMVGAGLFIHRKTRTIMAIILSCAAANIVMNVILVPRMGISGSAVATLVSYVAAALAMGFASRRLLPIALPWQTVLRAGAVASLMFFAITRVHLGGRFATIGVRIVLGIPIYALLILLIDPDARALVRERRRR
jgi:O-antigen/teichoic acid export membrane protein